MRLETIRVPTFYCPDDAVEFTLMFKDTKCSRTLSANGLYLEGECDSLSKGRRFYVRDYTPINYMPICEVHSIYEDIFYRCEFAFLPISCRVRLPEPTRSANEDAQASGLSFKQCQLS